MWHSKRDATALPEDSWLGEKGWNNVEATSSSNVLQR